MRSVDDCLDDIRDDDYWYLTCFESIKDEEVKNGILRRLYHSAECNDAGLALSNSLSLKTSIDAEALIEAQRLSELPDPLANIFDEVDAGLDRLTIRSKAA